MYFNASYTVVLRLSAGCLMRQWLRKGNYLSDYGTAGTLLSSIVQVFIPQEKKHRDEKFLDLI